MLDTAQTSTALNAYIGFISSNISVLNNITINTTDSTWELFAPTVQTLRTMTPDPDVIFVAMTPPATSNFLNAVRRSKWNPKAIMTSHGGCK